MSLRFTRKKRGGAFVAKGSYGCVFKKQPLKCKNERTRRNNSYISKLSSKNTAEEEYTQSRIIRHYDPTEKYFVTAEKECSLNNLNVQMENELSRCNLKQIKHAIRTKNYSNTGLVIYKDAGIDFHRIKLAVEDYIPFYESIANLFTGLKFIHSKGIIHRDLKSDNIISQKNADGSFTTRLIDVGFMCPLKPIEDTLSVGLNTNQQMLVRRCDFSYVRTEARTYGPFYEFMFGPPADSEKKTRIQEYQGGKDFSTVYEEWVEDVSKYLGSDDPFKGEDEAPAHKYSDVMDALVEVWSGYENKEFNAEPGAKNAGPEFVLKLTSKVDIFSFGMILAKLQERYIAHTVERKGGALQTFVPRSTILKNAGAPDLWVNVDELTRYGIAEQEAAWHTAVANRISIPIHQLMVKMSDLDPRRAIELDEALRDYTDILGAVRELYMPSKIYKGLKAVDDFYLLSPPLVKTAKRTSTRKSVAKPATPPKPSTPKPTKSKSTMKLKVGDLDKKLLKKKKKAYTKTIEEAKELIEEEEADMQKNIAKRNDLEQKRDKALRDKMAAKVITLYDKSISDYNILIERSREEIANVKKQIQEANDEYKAFKASLTRLPNST